MFFLDLAVFLKCGRSSKKLLRLSNLQKINTCTYTWREIQEKREAERETYVSLDACTLCICKYHILQNLYSDV